MAKVDDLLSHISNGPLREQLKAAVDELRSGKQFGLVFEHHIPETSLVPSLPVSRGAQVTSRTESWSGERVVESISGSSATVSEPATGKCTTESVSDLIVVKPFGDPVYPSLTPVTEVCNGPADRPWHSVICGENYHALQLLLYLYEGQVDCMYLDPPYNTGARDWTYNNRFVDANDAYRHSKWISAMDKRLRIAMRLLKKDGILIVTIDENEVHHLGMLLERVASNAKRQMVTICINPSGVSGQGLSRVNEYAFFCFQGDSQPVRVTDDMLTTSTDKKKASIRWEALMRGGNAWYRSSRPNLCYPILLDRTGKNIVGVGEPLRFHDDPRLDEAQEKSRPATVKGHLAAWPVRLGGKLGIWRVDGKKLVALSKKGYAYVSSGDDARGTWTIRYLLSGSVTAIESGGIEVLGKTDRGQAIVRRTRGRTALPKTMWCRGRHTAGGAGGTHLLAELLGDRGVFPFPKSVYAVRDCLEIAIGNRPDALVVDFFAGSGTTLNATMLLNAEDDGKRRCILVTNNEVDVETASLLAQQGHHRGDSVFESHGIFERVTQPRCKAALLGRREDGTIPEGEYIGGRSYADGFEENVVFFRLSYLNPDEVTLGRQYQAIVPLLWLAAGSIGQRPTPMSRQKWLLPKDSPFGVLINPDSFAAFASASASRRDLTHVWIVIDDEHAFARMQAQLPRRLHVGMLYRQYLRNFLINTERNV